jgi:cytidine deaminase
MTDEELIEAALAARKHAYSVYSGYRVGAALVDDRGRVHAGCNVENASYPQGSCAETAAIAAMIASGGKKIAAIAVAGGRDEPGDCTPCGGCRQRISEFADAKTRILARDRGEWRTFTMDELLPASFQLD